MSYFKEVIEEIDRGRLGLNEGLPMGFDRLVEHVPNLQRKTYYLVGGQTGGGKSSFVLDAFIYNPYDYLCSHPEVKAEFHYFSFEVSKMMMTTKGISRRLFSLTKKKLDTKYILSQGKNRISQEDYDLVLSTADYFNNLQNLLNIIDIPDNPTGVMKYLMKVAERNGKFIKERVEIDGKPVEIIKSYIPNDPTKYVIVVLDHIALTKGERGFTGKQNFDKLSEYFIWFRNICGFTIVVVQQLNREISQADRVQINRLMPQLSDFKDTGNTQQDAEIIMCLFNPHQYELQKFKDYDISVLQDRFRSISVLKNRYGASNAIVGTAFIGEVGVFKELPRGKDMTPSIYENILNA